MKFELTRAQEYTYGNTNITADSIFKDGFDKDESTYETAKQFCSKIESKKDENGFYTVYVTIDSIENLAKFCKAVGGRIIMETPYKDRELFEICIYDNYVE